MVEGGEQHISKPQVAIAKARKEQILIVQTSLNKHTGAGIKFCVIFYE